MSIKLILVYVDNDAGCAARVRLAGGLAVRHDAHLTALYMKRTLMLPAYAAVPLPEPVVVEYEQTSAKLAEQAKSVFNNSIKGLPVTSEWHTLSGFLPNAIAERTRFADLLVAAQAHDPTLDLNESYDPASVVLGAAAPVLIVPSVGDFEAPSRLAVIAWDNSHEAANSVHQALPLLSQMARTEVLQISKARDEERSGTEVSAYLARHGLEVAYDQHPRGDSGVGEAVLAQVAAHDGDLLVMGAYGHSRVLETVLGGTTRHVLAHMHVPVLMSH